MVGRLWGLLLSEARELRGKKQEILRLTRSTGDDKRHLHLGFQRGNPFGRSEGNMLLQNSPL